MTQEELIKFLKENLKIQASYGWQGSQKILNIKIMFDKKTVTKTDVTLEWDDDDF